MGAKRFLVFVGVTVSAMLLAVFLIATAPAINCFIGLILYDKCNIIRYESEVILVYNWVLGLIVFVMIISTIIMSMHKKLTLYAKLFMPYILSIILVMAYTGINIDYIGDGFVEVGKKPFSNYFSYKNRKGRTIIESGDYLVKCYHNGRIVFADNYDIYPNKLYNEYGDRFLTIPVDDEKDPHGIQIYRDLYYTQKSFDKDDGTFDYTRVRFFDMDGNYVITREYGSGGFHPNPGFRSGNLIHEYIEDVDEIANGIKEFETKENY